MKHNPSIGSLDALDCNAYNAAFYELGLRWHWDESTYTRLLDKSPDPADRLRHYLQAAQPHLLKAYDADFLIRAIQQKQVEQRAKVARQPSLLANFFDWAQARGGELGS
jgi:hypothetical protein